MKTNSLYISILFMLIQLTAFSQKKGGDCGCTKNNNKHDNGYYMGAQVFSPLGFYFNPTTEKKDLLISFGGGIQAGLNIHQSSSIQFTINYYNVKNIPARANLLFGNTYTTADINYNDITVEWVKRFFLQKSKKIVPYFTMGINNHISNKRKFKYFENSNGNESASKLERGFNYYTAAFTFSGGINRLLGKQTSAFIGIRLSNNLPAIFSGKHIEGAFDRQLIIQTGINFHF